MSRSPRAAPGPVDASGVTARAAAQERFCTDLAADRCAAGPAGRAVLVATDTDLVRRRHELALLTALARDLVATGWGVVLRTPAALVAGRRGTRPLDAADLLVSTAPDLDPSVVPARTRSVGWAVGSLDEWCANRRLAVHDRVLAASAVAAERITRQTGCPVGVAVPQPDAVAFSRAESGTGPVRELITVVAPQPLGAVGEALTPLLATGRLRIHAPRAAVPTPLRTAGRPPLRAVDRPAAFARSLAVVLPEADAARIGSGIVEAFALEAAAAGAVPVLRTALGVTEAGLDGALVSPTPSGIRPLLTGLLADAGEARAAGARLADRFAAAQEPAAVRARLSLFTGTGDVGGDVGLPPVLVPLPALASSPTDGRADGVPVVGFPVRADGPIGPGPRPAVRSTLGWFPDLQRTNPFQPMLYRRLQAEGVRVAPVLDALSAAVLRDDGGRLDRYVLNLHWTSIVVQDGTSVYDAASRLRRFTAQVNDLVSRGGRLVWTVHNVLSHDVRYRDLEVDLCRYLARTASLVHVLGVETVAAAAPWYALDPARLVVIPHSSYLGEYPDTVTRADARRRLGFSPGEVVLATVGGIRPYRGLDRLLDVFEALSATDPRLRLLVAGRPGREPEVARWLDRCRADPRVTLRAGHVGDADLQVLHRAADLVVLPYRGILNSGAFQLAQTFGAPVVAPRAGSLAALVDTPGAIGFDPADTADLTAAVAEGVDLVTDPVGGPAARAAAAAAAAANAPTAMADAFAVALHGAGVLR